jgi:hypothetical protein
MVINTKALTVALIGAIALCSVPAYAQSSGKVVKIVGDEDKPVPKHEDTHYKSELNNFEFTGALVASKISKPNGGTIGMFLVEGIKLTMKEKKFKNRAIETAELGKVRVFTYSGLASKNNGVGFWVLLTDEQLKKLDKLVAQAKKK